ncbi:MAG: hypothetical protein LAP38_10885 [Acidobacteriia bacterium]|nr:hypothetical protein [Terriglobia bacterium]
MRIFVTATTLLVLVLLAAPAVAQDRPNFSGNWQFDASKSELHNLKLANATWTIKQDDSSIDIAENEGGSGRAIELKCTTDGKDCKVSGEKAKASMWYNGPMLVEMETRGDHVVRYRLTMSQDGKTMKVETTQIVPQTDGIDVLVFEKHS